MERLGWRALGGCGVLVATLAATSVALAWQTDVPFLVRVHGHSFERVEVDGTDCLLRAKLHFTAPEAAYQAETAVRNHYRFRARVHFSGGKHIESGLFFSAGPARRTTTIEHDTTADGCWATALQNPVNLQVEGCRGAGCVVEPFTQ